MSTLPAIEKTTSTSNEPFEPQISPIQENEELDDIKQDQIPPPSATQQQPSLSGDDMPDKVDRIESVDDDNIDEYRQQSQIVLKRAETVMLTDQMQWFEDDYVKLEPLGEPGTFGMAFKCHKRSNKEIMYAVKQINKAKFYFNEQKGILQNMKNEIQIMNILGEHENICKLHETYEDRNYIFLILDFLSGGELFAKIDTEELEEKEVQIITKQILSAIKYMQQNNIAHLDLKPDNILFINDKPDSPIKIIDFGEARIVKNEEKLNQKIGTPYYMAPEIIREVPYDPFPADMWSVGVIIFCMLFGFVPFLAEEEDEIFEKIKIGFKPQVCEGWGAFFPKEIPISDDARDLISGLLESDPSQRLTIDDCLTHPWIKGDITEIVKKQSTLQPLRRDTQRQSMRRLFLVKEQPLDIPDWDEEEENNMADKPHMIGDHDHIHNDEDEDEYGDEIEDDYVSIDLPQNGIIKKGYMRKEGKLFKSWKRRWFILQNNGVVSYYHSHHDDKPIHQFSVKNYKYLLKSNKIQYGIILCTQQRNWKLICLSDKQRNEWMAAFEKAAKRGGKSQGALTVDGQQFNKIRKSIDNGKQKQIGNGYGLSMGSSNLVNRDRKISLKIDDTISREFEEMMKDLDIKEEKREEMLNLDKQQKIDMIQQWKISKIYNEKDKDKQQKKKRTSFSLPFHKKSSVESNSSEKLPNVKPMHSQSKSDEFKYNEANHLSPHPFSTKPRTVSVSLSLAQSSEAIRRKRTSAQLSQFGIKHEKIMNQLVIATKSRIATFENDAEIITNIGKAFEIKQNKNDDLKDKLLSNTINGKFKIDDFDDHYEEEEDDMDNFDMFARSSTMQPASYTHSSLLGNKQKQSPFQLQSLPKSNTIHFGRDELKNNTKNKKYVCKLVDNVAFNVFIEVIEFMLKELWDEQCTKDVYEKLVKRISLTQKAKLFSIGVDRRNRTYLFKKYQSCFVGSEGVDWLIEAKFVKNTDDKRERAKDLGNSFLTKGFIRHVVDDHKFKDEKLWYQFNDAMIDKQCLIESNSLNPIKPNHLPQSLSETNEFAD